jgi:hypothetical protein
MGFSNKNDPPKEFPIQFFLNLYLIYFTIFYFKVSMGDFSYFYQGQVPYHKSLNNAKSLGPPSIP